MIPISDSTLSKFPGVAECNSVKDILTELHNTYGKSFREIKALSEFSGIPLRTLHSIYSGKRDVPKKYRARFNLPQLAPAPVCPIHDTVHDYDCQTQATYNPATERVFPAGTEVRKPRKPYTKRTPRNWEGKLFVF